METFSIEDQQAICDTFSRLLGDMADEKNLRQVIETESGFETSKNGKLYERRPFAYWLDMVKNASGQKWPVLAVQLQCKSKFNKAPLSVGSSLSLYTDKCPLSQILALGLV